MDRIFGNRRHGDGDNNTFVDIERNDSMHSDSKSQSHLRHHKRFGAQRSDQRPLTTIDVVEEIRSNHERCRLLLVEIARRKTPSASRIFKDKTKKKNSKDPHRNWILYSVKRLGLRNFRGVLLYPVCFGTNQLEHLSHRRSREKAMSSSRFNIN